MACRQVLGNERRRRAERSFDAPSSLRVPPGTHSKKSAHIFRSPPFRFRHRMLRSAASWQGSKYSLLDLLWWRAWVVSQKPDGILLMLGRALVLSRFAPPHGAFSAEGQGGRQGLTSGTFAYSLCSRGPSRYHWRTTCCSAVRARKSWGWCSRARSRRSSQGRWRFAGRTDSLRRWKIESRRGYRNFGPHGGYLRSLQPAGGRYPDPTQWDPWDGMGHDARPRS